jgi:hypothetical protein
MSSGQRDVASDAPDLFRRHSTQIGDVERVEQRGLILDRSRKKTFDLDADRPFAFAIPSHEPAVAFVDADAGQTDAVEMNHQRIAFAVIANRQVRRVDGISVDWINPRRLFGSPGGEWIG